MSFGNKSDVHNHISTKHPLFPHKLVTDETPAVLVEPLQKPEPVALNIPATPVNESTVGSF